MHLNILARQHLSSLLQACLCKTPTNPWTSDILRETKLQRKWHQSKVPGEMRSISLFKSRHSKAEINQWPCHRSPVTDKSCLRLVVFILLDMSASVNHQILLFIRYLRSEQDLTHINYSWGTPGLSIWPLTLFSIHNNHWDISSIYMDLRIKHVGQFLFKAFHVITTVMVQPSYMHNSTCANDPECGDIKTTHITPNTPHLLLVSIILPKIY